MGWKLIIVDKLPDSSEVPDYSEQSQQYRVFLEPGNIGKIPKSAHRTIFDNAATKTFIPSTIIIIVSCLYFLIN